MKNTHLFFPDWDHMQCHIGLTTLRGKTQGANLYPVAAMLKSLRELPLGSYT